MERNITKAKPTSEGKKNLIYLIIYFC